MKVHTHSIVGRRFLWIGNFSVPVEDIVEIDNNAERVIINCQTRTYRFVGEEMKALNKYFARGSKDYRKKCANCEKKIGIEYTLCRACSNKARVKINWPDVEILIQEVKNKSWAQVGRELGVSASSVRSRILKYGKEQFDAEFVSSKAA